MTAGGGRVGGRLHQCGTEYYSRCVGETWIVFHNSREGQSSAVHVNVLIPRRSLTALPAAGHQKAMTRGHPLDPWRKMTAIRASGMEAQLRSTLCLQGCGSRRPTGKRGCVPLMLVGHSVVHTVPISVGKGKGEGGGGADVPSEAGW